MTDRVNYSFSMKVPTEVEYSTVGFSASVSPDVKEGESVKEAFDRVRKVVMDEIDKDFDQYG